MNNNIYICSKISVFTIISKYILYIKIKNVRGEIEIDETNIPIKCFQSIIIHLNKISVTRNKIK